MKPSSSILLLISTSRLLRADMGGGGAPGCVSVPRPAGMALAAAVKAALDLGGKARGMVWVLAEELFEHKVILNPSQVAGLTPEQTARALAFEAEPFSGIPVLEGVTGFRADGDGIFDVVEITRADREAIQKTVAAAGGRLAGISHSGTPPAEEQPVTWLLNMQQKLEMGSVPVIGAAVLMPSPRRFTIAGAALGAGALALVLAIMGVYALQRAGLEAQNAALTAAGTRLDEANKEAQALRKELVNLDNRQDQREKIAARRAALPAVLKALANLRSEDIVVRGIKDEGPSSLLVSGLSLEAGAVDELGIILSQSLHEAGWTAQVRSKTGKRVLPGGGPWEFMLAITHAEAEPARLVHAGRRGINP